MVWTQFMDMHSGGELKTDYGYIYIELPMSKAEDFFEEEFNRNPNNITCECCGPDFYVSEYDSLEQATGFERNCEYNRETHKYEESDNCVSLEEYKKKKNVLIVYKNEV